MATIFDPIKMRFYTEKFDKENRNVKLSLHFSPSLKNKPITGKFYSKYDKLGSIKIPIQYLRMIERHEQLIPSQIYSYKPPATNMNYGWFSQPLVPRSTDPRLYFPLKHSSIVKTEMRIRDIDKGIPREQFHGIPFKTK